MSKSPVQVIDSAVQDVQGELEAIQTEEEKLKLSYAVTEKRRLVDQLIEKTK